MIVSKTVMAISVAIVAACGIFGWSASNWYRSEPTKTFGIWRDSGSYPFMLPLTFLSCFSYHPQSGETMSGWHIKQPITIDLRGATDVMVRDSLIESPLEQSVFCGPMVDASNAMKATFMNMNLELPYGPQPSRVALK